ncbi:MAG: GTPase ObgE [Candidatus Paceibacterota bacterium]|jgi:GTP-binding protein
MAFVDELKLHIKAGHGGDGVVRWRHEKGREFAGASGGNGGKGGDIYIRAVRDIGILARYKNSKEFLAQNGASGQRDSMHGRDGDDLTINLPIGSVITNLETREKFNLDTDEQIIKILNGGKGGLGNEYFKSSTNVSPEQQTDGKRGEEADFEIEVELVADAGFIGLPNAGKSSLLNELTNAHSKVGAYQFTTLEPALGAMRGFVLADIPGLIEGASEGRGLGHKFLRHIKRTKILLHCLSLEDEVLVKNYKVIRKELKDYSEELAEKKEIVILTKTDLVDAKKLSAAKKKIEKLNKNILTVTVYDNDSIKELGDKLIKILRAEK